MRPSYPVVEVTWRDAHGGDNGWQPIGELNGKPAVIRSVGMLARKTPDGLVLILSHDRTNGNFGGHVFILHENITSTEVLRP